MPTLLYWLHLKCRGQTDSACMTSGRTLLARLLPCGGWHLHFNVEETGTQKNHIDDQGQMTAPHFEFRLEAD